MPESGRQSATYVGEIAAVRGSVVTIRLSPTASNLLLIRGESYRVGQIGGFVRIPLGYADLYAVSTQVGADGVAVVTDDDSGSLEHTDSPSSGFKWLTAALFGETTSGRFERGVSQYPTVGDEVHVVTAEEMDVIYDRELGEDDLTIGRIASANGIPARLQLSTLVTRHSSIVGSTGSGKSNLVGVIIEELSNGSFPSARVLVVDPHGEYSSVGGEQSRVIRSSEADKSASVLRVPYWALPLDELLALTMGDMQPVVAEYLRDRVRDLKVAAAAFLENAPPVEAITADSPVPFSIRRLWFELEHEERATYLESNNQNASTLLAADIEGDEDALIPPHYPPPTSVNTSPYPNRKRRGIAKQLDLLRSRLRDSQFSFMFDFDHATSPDHDGRIEADLDTLLIDWVGGDQTVTVVDVSGLPAEALSTVVGTMLGIIYDALFWAMSIDVGGRSQPLLVILDEAHLFLPSHTETAAHKTFARIAKEGRKYGVGLMIVTQRPSDIDANVLSQCGTMIALRVTNGLDRSAVSGSVPDDLGSLTDMLPSLKTGEALVLGDALQIPSRVRIRHARNKPNGNDPDVLEQWLKARPPKGLYKVAVKNWRLRSTEAKGS